MQVIPEKFLIQIQADKLLNKALMDIDSKVETIVTKQAPFFFPQYTDHGIHHFRDTLKMAQHLIDIDDIDRSKGAKAIIETLSPLNSFILVASILYHDLGMHIHYKGFRQLIDGYYDDVRVDFFNDLTWKQEWENFYIEAKRFSGRQRFNLFGSEDINIRDIDFSKNSVDSDEEKLLIGEFIRRHHGRLAHEIALKGFPIQTSEVINFASELKDDFKDIIGLIARSHSMHVRDAMGYIEERFPADPQLPYEIEVPFLMCVLRVADYFQFDSSRTNAFLIKLKSFASRFSELEHETHLSTQYFKTHDKDPETLFVDLKPDNGQIFKKLISLFDDIQNELDTSFAIIGEVYGRTKEYLKLRYRRIITNLSNRKVVNKFDFVADTFRFEADTDLFKLLVGPLYGYDPSFGVREILQNAVDACIELSHKISNNYIPDITISVSKTGNDFIFDITDNGKGMSIGEVKNYYLKAGASFRNSTEWKLDFMTEDNNSVIRRTGKFGIGVLASFLIGDQVEVTTKRFNAELGYSFIASLNASFIEVKKNRNCAVGTNIRIKMTKENYEILVADNNKLIEWFVLSYPKVSYFVNGQERQAKETKKIELLNNSQTFQAGINLKHDKFEDIIWSYQFKKYLAINGIVIPSTYYFPSGRDYNGVLKKKNNIYDALDNFPFVSILDRNNLIDLELNRNAIRGDLPFIKELVESCQLEFLYNLIFFYCPIKDNILDLSKDARWDGEIKLLLPSSQYNTNSILVTKTGYFLNNSLYNSLVKHLNCFKLFGLFQTEPRVELIDGAICSLTRFSGTNGERQILRGDYKPYLLICKPHIYYDHIDSQTITKFVRENIILLEETDSYVLCQHGNYSNANTDFLKKLFQNRNLEAVQQLDVTISNHENLQKLLKEHLFDSALIPHDLNGKKQFAKTLGPRIRKYIEEDKGISLD